MICAFRFNFFHAGISKSPTEKLPTTRLPPSPQVNKLTPTLSGFQILNDANFIKLKLAKESLPTA